MTTTSSGKADDLPADLTATYRLIPGKPVMYELSLELHSGPLPVRTIETESPMTRLDVLRAIFSTAQRHRPRRIFLRLHDSPVPPMELGHDNVKRIIDGEIEPQDIYIGG